MPIDVRVVTIAAIVIAVAATPALAEDMVNVAAATAGGSASASTYEAAYGATYLAAHAIDGDRRGVNSYWNDGTFGEYPDWLQVDFNGTYPVSRVDLFGVQDASPPIEPTPSLTFTQFGVVGFDVEYWTGSAWATVPGGSITNNTLVWRTVTFAPVMTSKIRVVVNTTDNAWSRIVEVEAWATAINVAAATAGGIASASSYESTYGSTYAAAHAIDGDRRGVNGYWNDGTFGVYPDWLQVDFDGTYPISQVDLFGVQDASPPIEPTPSLTFTQFGVVGFDVEYWTGSAWTTVPGGSITNNTLVWRTVTFAPVMTSKIRVVVNTTDNAWSRIVEVEAYTAATVVQLPTLTSLNPTSGVVGQVVILTGSNLGASQGIGTVSFSGIAATPTAWNATSITVPVPSGATTGPVAVTVGGQVSNGITFTMLPAISGVSPNVGTAGTQVTVSGSNFGNAQGSSTLWLGARVGIVTSWSDSQIVAVVATGSLSGSVQVRRIDGVSSSVPFTVLIPTITGVSPAGGAPGTQVTIIGSTFGGTQGTGQVWLGSAAGIVTSWSDTQVVATIAVGSQSGDTQVLQYGVSSNAMPLTVTGGLPRIGFVSPTKGASGTLVTLYGSGFGATQGSGVVRLGNATATVSSWNNTQVSVTVSTYAVSGVVKLQQNGVWSNAVPFRVPGLAGIVSVIAPSFVSMVVGEQRSLQALGDDGAPVTGSVWSSSDTDIVSLSSANPPVLTAVSPGNITITVGSASAEVTVYQGPFLPIGTIIWSNGANTGGGIYPAVPNYDAVADVFAVDDDGAVHAITAEGSTAWTYQGLDSPWLFPDFQGGAVAFDSDQSLWHLDPLTGQPLPLFAYITDEGQAVGYAEPRVHPDGTVFTTDYTCAGEACTGSGTDADTGTWIVGIDAKTGTRKFRVSMQNWTDVGTVTDEAFCQSTSATFAYHPWAPSWSAIVAGDGFYYVNYVGYDWTGTTQRSAAQPYPDAAYDLWDQLGADIIAWHVSAALADHAALRAATGEGYNSWDSQLDQALNTGQRTQAITLLNQIRLRYKRLCDHASSTVTKLHVLRVGSDGSSADTVLKTWTSSQSSIYTLASVPQTQWGYLRTETHLGPDDVNTELNMMTDADKGALVSWGGSESCYQNSQPDVVWISTCVPANDDHLTLLTDGAVASDFLWGHTGLNPVRLALQLEDGSFVGTPSASTATTLVFNASGAVKWRLPGYSPEIAVEGGGLLVAPASGTGTTEFDGNGSAVARVPDLARHYSWNGSTYESSSGVVERRENARPLWAPTYASMSGGNPSIFGTFIRFLSSPFGTALPQLVDYGGACRLGNAQPTLLAGGSDSVHADAVFRYEWQRLLDFPGLTEPGGSCKTLLQDSFAGIRSHAQGLVPFDGTRTTKSVFDMRLFSAQTPAALEAARRQYSDVPTCSIFLDLGVTAAAQGTPLPGDPGSPKNVFITSTVYRPSLGPPIIVADRLRPSTILHEALHGLTLKGDGELARYFAANAQMIDPERSNLINGVDAKNSVLLSDKLETYVCAPR